MRKIYFAILFALCASFGQTFGQCEERTYFEEDFTSGMPSCWKIFQSFNGSNFNSNNGVLQTHQSQAINIRYAIMYRVAIGNGQGYFTFDAKGNGGQTAIEIGVVDTNTNVTTYDSIQQVAVTSEMATYSVDLSSYSGTGKYLVIKESTTAMFQAITMDNFYFTPTPIINASICYGEQYSVGDSSYSADGLYVTTLKDVQNNDSLVSTFLTVNSLPIVEASTSKDKLCLGDSVLLSAHGADTYTWTGNVVSGQYSFPTTGGAYVVTGTSTATGCSSIDTIEISIAHIEQVGVSGSDTICSGTALNLDLDNTISGFTYQLRNKLNGQQVGNTITGNGSSQSFTLPAQTESTMYNVIATGTVGTESSNALRFPGVTTTEVETSTPNTATNALTLEAWVNVKPDGLGTVISNIPTTDFYNANGFVALTVRGNGAVYFSLGLNGSTTFTYLVVDNGITPNTWQHVAATFSSSAMKVYIDGVEAGTVSLSNKTIPSSSNLFSIGRQFKGKIDEVRIWNTTRTVQQINDNMNKCLTGTESGLRAYFNFEEGSGNSVKNKVNNSDATFTANDISWASGSTVSCASGCAVALSESAFVQIADIDTTLTHSVETLSVYDGVTVPANTTFQWLDCDANNAPIQDATNTDFTAGNTGNYACEISQGSCVLTSSCQPIVISGTEDLKNTQLLMLPNPASTTLSFQTEESIDKVIITSISGITQDLNLSDSQTIDVSELKNGIYIVHVYTPSSILKQQFVKQ